jgi:ABC-2 type transport system ATP-binding protein
MADVTALASRVLIVNHGRLLYDGALDALVARLAPVKRLAVVLGEQISAEELRRFGTLRRFEFPYATLEIPRADAAAVSAELLAAVPVVDLSIEDPPIEEVIQQAFAESALAQVNDADSSPAVRTA